MNSHTIAESRRLIDEYAREEGTTWENMRRACGLDVECAKKDHRRPTASEILEKERERLVNLSDALAVLAIEQNVEVSMTPASLGALWKKLGRQHPVSEDQGVGVLTDLFQKMVDSGLWISHGFTQKGIQCYCPVIRCEGSLVDIYTCDNDGSESIYPEIINKKALERYTESESRRSNNALLRDYDLFFYVTN